MGGVFFHVSCYVFKGKGEGGIQWPTESHSLPITNRIFHRPLLLAQWITETQKPFKGTREENLSTELTEMQAINLHCFPPSTLYTHRADWLRLLTLRIGFCSWESTHLSAFRSNTSFCRNWHTWVCSGHLPGHLHSTHPTLAMNYCHLPKLHFRTGLGAFYRQGPHLPTVSLWSSVVEPDV